MRGYDVVEFRRADVHHLDVQPAQAAYFDANHAMWDHVAEQGEAFTFSRDDSGPLVIAGVTSVWHGRGVVWAVFSRFTDRYDLLELTRRVRAFLDEAATDPKYRRLETTVRADWPSARRWAGMIGMEEEGVMRAYGVEGEDHVMCARVGPCH